MKPSDPRDGGPAFPTLVPPLNPPVLFYDQALGVSPPEYIGPQMQTGMTLRDWFAGQSLLSMLSQPSVDAQSWADVAHIAYAIADAMLAERAK